MPLRIVVDASFIIGLREISALHLLIEASKRMNIKFIIPDGVLVEVSRKANSDTGKIVEAIGDGIIEKRTPHRDEFEKLRNRYPRLGRGELEAITIAKSGSYSDCILLLDDGDARKLASSSEVEFHGLIWFLEQCCHRKVLDKNRTLDLLNKIEHSSFRIKKQQIEKAKQRIRDFAE